MSQHVNLAGVLCVKLLFPFPGKGVRLSLEDSVSGSHLLLLHRVHKASWLLEEETASGKSFLVLPTLLMGEITCSLCSGDPVPCVCFCLEISFQPPQGPHTLSLSIYLLNWLLKNVFVFMCMYVYRCISIHVQARGRCHVFSFLGIYLIFETASFDEPWAHCFG